MTHFLQRSALILLATSALGASPALARTHHPHARKPAEAAKGEEAGAKAATYTVKTGDTLEKIAGKAGVSIDDLRRLNGLKKRSLLHPGQVLKTAAATRPAAKAGKASKGEAAAKKDYVVVRGDTLFSISKRLGVSIDDLRAANGLSARAQIHAGQTLRLSGAVDEADQAPAKAGRGGKSRRERPSVAEASDQPAADRSSGGKVTTIRGRTESYKVRKGDTLATVADRLDTDIGQLKAINHLRSSKVRAGQVLRGPSFTEHVYTAVAGDTLAGIAERFGVSVERLRSENEMSRRVRSVRAGQKVYLPDGYRERGGETSAPSERPSRSYPRPAEPSRGDAQLPSHPQPYQPSGQTPRPYIPPAGAQTPAAQLPQAAAAPTDAQVSQMGKGRFLWPLRGDIISDFGPKAGGQRNDGINIQAEAGAPVRAAAAGDVVYAGDQVPGFGNLVLIKHADGWVTAYGHLSRIDVKNREKVTQGQQIGQAGNTGGVPEPQLHFEVRYAPNPGDPHARPVDPKLVLPK
ncbi:MAG: LysM peptidoglycan-binding domain-containing protein [Caulobacterales bacterium]